MLGDPKLFDFDSSKFTETPFPVQQWGGAASGVPGATNLPSVPQAPVSIDLHDPSNVTTLVPYSGQAALQVIEGADLKPLALEPGAFSQAPLGKGSHALEQFDSPKFDRANPFK